MRRALVLGMGAGCLYLVIAAVTDGQAPMRVRPVFDGFAPPPPYRWVTPPPELAASNRPPESADRVVELTAGGSPTVTTTTGDRQAEVVLEAGSVPPSPTETSVRVRVTPLDPATLGPIPPGLRPQSNAYRLSIAYGTSMQEMTSLARPGAMALTAAATADTVLYSADGRTWSPREARPYGHTLGLFTPIETTGWFLLAGRADDADDGGGSPLRYIGFAVLGLAPLALALLLLRRRPQEAPARPGRPTGGRRPPPPKKRKKPGPRR